MKSKIFIIISLLTAGFLFSGCSEDEAQTYDLNDLQFIVNVDTGNDAKTRGIGKTGWEDGDIIFFTADQDDDNILKLKYSAATGQWDISQLVGETNLKHTGTIQAVYADDLSYSSKDGIKTLGDVLYTRNGTYELTGKVVLLTLHMTERPVSRITIEGMDPSYWISGMTEYTSMLSLGSMKWNTAIQSKGELTRFVYDDKCVFYGVLDPNQDGDTQITLLNAEGHFFKRTYIGKSAWAGSAITLQGPLSGEADEWSDKTDLAGFTVLRDSITMEAGEMLNAWDFFRIIPENAFTDAIVVTSDNDCVSVDEKGMLTAQSKGDATITVKDGRSGISCSFVVTVFDITDFISLNMTYGIAIPGGQYTTFIIQNNSTHNIYIDKLEFYADSVLVTEVSAVEGTLGRGNRSSYTLSSLYYGKLKAVLYIIYENKSYFVTCEAYIAPPEPDPEPEPEPNPEPGDEPGEGTGTEGGGTGTGGEGTGTGTGGDTGTGE